MPSFGGKYTGLMIPVAGFYENIWSRACFNITPEALFVNWNNDTPAFLCSKTMPKVDKDEITSEARDLYLQIVENIFIGN